MEVDSMSNIVNDVSMKLARLSQTLQAINTQKEHLSSNVLEIKPLIDNKFDAIVDTLEKVKNDLCLQLTSLKNARLKELDRKKHDIEALMAELEHTQKFEGIPSNERDKRELQVSLSKPIPVLTSGSIVYVPSIVDFQEWISNTNVLGFVEFSTDDTNCCSVENIPGKIHTIVEEETLPFQITMDHDEVVVLDDIAAPVECDKRQRGEEYAIPRSGLDGNHESTTGASYRGNDKHGLHCSKEDDFKTTERNKIDVLDISSDTSAPVECDKRQKGEDRTGQEYVIPRSGLDGNHESTTGASYRGNDKHGLYCGKEGDFKTTERNKIDVLDISSDTSLVFEEVAPRPESSGMHSTVTKRNSLYPDLSEFMQSLVCEPGKVEMEHDSSDMIIDSVTGSDIQESNAVEEQSQRSSNHEKHGWKSSSKNGASSRINRCLTDSNIDRTIENRDFVHIPMTESIFENDEQTHPSSLLVGMKKLTSRDYIDIEKRINSVSSECSEHSAISNLEIIDSEKCLPSKHHNFEDNTLEIEFNKLPFHGNHEQRAGDKDDTDDNEVHDGGDDDGLSKRASLQNCRRNLRQESSVAHKRRSENQHSRIQSKGTESQISYEGRSCGSKQPKPKASEGHPAVRANHEKTYTDEESRSLTGNEKVLMERVADPYKKRTTSRMSMDQDQLKNRKVIVGGLHCLSKCDALDSGIEQLCATSKNKKVSGSDTKPDQRHDKLPEDQKSSAKPQMKIFKRFAIKGVLTPEKWQDFESLVFSSKQSKNQVTVRVGLGNIVANRSQVLVNHVDGRSLDFNGRISKSIQQKTGVGIIEEYREQRRNRGPLEAGQVLHTSAGKIGTTVKHILHVVGPRPPQFSCGHEATSQALFETFHNCFDYANNRLQSPTICLAPMGTGSYGVEVVTRELFRALDAFDVYAGSAPQKDVKLKNIRIVETDVGRLKEMIVIMRSLMM